MARVWKKQRLARQGLVAAEAGPEGLGVQGVQVVQVLEALELATI